MRLVSCSLSVSSILKGYNLRVQLLCVLKYLKSVLLGLAEFELFVMLTSNSLIFFYS